ncbi:MAG: YjgP/YjgQ family permease [Bacteroidetes bacterium]|nr:MAG: YjgP/YjgQ family permease [Bacteroidota bacterium]
MFKLLSIYVLRNHAAPFFFGVVLVVFLFLFQFILKSIDQLIGKGLDTWVIIQLIGLNTAWMIVLAVPIGVLFSTLMAFGSMSSSHEITIFKSSGASLWRMMTPVLISGVILTLALFWFNDEILPEANHRAKVLMSDITRKKPTFSIEAGQFSNAIDGYTILARSVDSLRGTLKGVTIYDNTKPQGLNIVSADSGIAKFTNDETKLILDLYKGEIHQFYNNDVKNYRKVDFQKYQIMMNASGFSLTRSSEDAISRGDREMHIRDMQKIVDESNASARIAEKQVNKQFKRQFNYLIGKEDLSKRRYEREDEDANISLNTAMKNASKRIDFLISSVSSSMMRKTDYELRAEQYIVEIQKKYAIPFACIVFILVGCPLGIITRGGNFGFSAAITLGFYILYWACLIGGEKFADRGIMSPVLSMWLGNIIVGVLGLYLTIRVNNESFKIGGMALIENIKRKVNDYINHLKLRKWK